MKRGILKIALLVLLAIVLLFISFYIWASSARYDSSEYSILTRNIKEEIEYQDSVYSLLTYNIGFLSGLTNNRAIETDELLYNNNLKTTLRNLTNINASILCFQEIDYDSQRSNYINQEEAIQNLGYLDAYRAVNWDELYLPFPGGALDFNSHYGSIYSGQSIISKFPLEIVERIVLERPENHKIHESPFQIDRLIQHAKVVIDSQEVHIVNVHLEAYDRDARIKQINFLKNHIEPLISDAAIIVTGDFNSDMSEKNSGIQIIEDMKGLQLANTGGKEESLTFPSNRPTERLDYIFFNPQFIEMIDSKVLSHFGTTSDHLPVWMSFKLVK